MLTGSELTPGNLSSSTNTLTQLQLQFAEIVDIGTGTITLTDINSGPPSVVGSLDATAASSSGFIVTIAVSSLSLVDKVRNSRRSHVCETFLKICNALKGHYCGDSEWVFGVEVRIQFYQDWPRMGV